MTKRLTLVMPHPDDEILLAGSLILKEFDQKTVYFSHAKDMHDNVKRIEETEYLQDIADVIFVENPTDTLKFLECDFKEKRYDMEVLVYPKASYHPSHQECCNISRQILRHPYKDRLDLILEAGHANSEFNGDSEYNYFVEINRKEMIFLQNQLTQYGLIGWYGPETFHRMMEYYGAMNGKDHAQPFLLKKGIF